VKLILLSLLLLAILLAVGVVAALVGKAMLAIAPVLAVLWVVFALFTLYFFRDPDASTPAGAGLVISPAHGRVDAIGTTREPKFMGGDCQRISIFLSVMDIHVQNAPVDGRVAFFEYTQGQFINALKAESAEHNENVLLGFEPAGAVGRKIGVRLIAGVLARRIVPFVRLGDAVARGERVSLIQFGSRADVYLPAGAAIKVKLGDRVVGGETVVASFP